MKNREAIAIISIIIANMIFGSTIIATKIILNTGFPVLFLLAWRMTIAALSLSILFAFHIFKGNITWPRLKKLLPLGLISPCLYFTAESIGIQMTSGAISGSILAMIPIATLLISQLTFKEKHPRLQIAAILLSIAGVILITLAGDCELVFDPLGYLALFIAVGAAAYYQTRIRVYAQSYTSLEITLGTTIIAAVVFTLLAIAQAAAAHTLPLLLQLPLIQPQILLWIIFLAVVSSIGAYSLFHYSISVIGPTRNSVFVGVSTLTSIICGIVVLHEVMSWPQLAGAAMVITGTWAANHYALPLPKTTSTP